MLKIKIYYKNIFSIKKLCKKTFSQTNIEKAMVKSMTYVPSVFGIVIAVVIVVRKKKLFYKKYF
jgi:hypothetical protein